MAAKTEVELSFKHSIAARRLKVEYTVVNHSQSVIYVLDRMWDREKNKLDTDWAYADISGKAAGLKRALEPVPRGLIAEDPRVPYGREVAPGQSVTSSFRVTLPLKQNGEYDNFHKRKPAQTVEVDSLALQVGWCPKAAMNEAPPENARVKIGGESLWLFGYHELEKCQQLARSAPVAARLRARILSSK